jgi:hypothetical protein
MGTLWRIREDLWASLFSGRASYKAKRQWHPGLSLRLTPVESILEYIPMLHGTSGDQGPVVVKGVTRHRGPDYVTSFGHIVRPAPVSAREIIEEHRGVPPPDIPDYDPLVRWRAVPNSDKPKLDEPEMQALAQWAKEKHLL